MMHHRFSPSARRSLAAAGALAGRLERPRLGTDVLLAALAAGTGSVADALAAAGAGGDEVRAVVARRWGWETGAGDAVLLASVGIDLDEVRRHLPASVVPHGWTLERSPVRPLRVSLVGPAGRWVLSGQARKVVEVAQWWARRRRRRVTEVDLLRGMLCDPASRSHQVLGELRVDACQLFAGFCARGLPT